MGDELDGLDLPLHEQSGNMDRNQISELNERELQEQSGALSQVLENYYQGGTNFNQVLTEITDLGYSEDRARQIRGQAQTERTIRFQTGHPSELAGNQLQFLERNHQTLLNSQFQIHTDPDGRQYIDDARVRELDGTPSKLYLPEPVAFNPLTIAQQEEQQRRLDNARPDFLQDFQTFEDPPPGFAASRLDTDFNNNDRSVIDAEATQYLNNPTEDQLARMRENIGLFIRPNSIRNQNEVLNQFMIDIQYEAQFRTENNGRPQLLSQEQYDILRGEIQPQSGQNIRINWDGGAIYENENGELYYRDSQNGRLRSIPNLNEQGEINYPFLASDINLPPSITGNYVGQFAPETYDPSFNIRPERTDLNTDTQSRLQRDMADAINGGKSYSDFLTYLQNNYELSNQQFIDVAQAVSMRREDLSYQDIIATQSYVDSPLYFYTDSRGVEQFTQSERIYRNIALSRGISQEAVDAQVRVFQNDFQVSHTAQQTSLTITPVIQPSLNVLEQIRQGLTTQEDIDNRFLERPRPFIDRGATGILDQLGRADPIQPEQLPDRPERNIGYDEFGNPILLNFSQEDIFDYIDNPDNTNAQIDSLLYILPQEQVTQEVRDRARGRGALRGLPAGGLAPPGFDPPIVAGQTQPILPSGQELSPPLPQEQVERYRNFFNSRQNQFTPFRNMFRDFLPIFTGAAGGYFAFSLARSRERGTIQEIINQERIFLDTLQTRLETQLENVGEARRRQDLADLEVEREHRLQEIFERQTKTESVSIPLQEALDRVEEAEDILDNLEMDIANDKIQRAEINNKLDRLLEFDREILNDINRYNPEILFGFSIGQTLGLALSGYFFPTYVDIEDNNEFIKADNINYNPKQKQKEKEERDKHKRSKPKPLKDLQKGSITAGEGNLSRRQPDLVRTFIPIRGSFSSSAGTPLSYKQIQDYKSTLNKEELSRLQGKMLIFGENKKVYPKENKCKSVVGTNIINKLPIKI